MPLITYRRYKTGDYLADASMEADVAKGRRDWAFSERDKVGPLLILIIFW